MAKKKLLLQNNPLMAGPAFTDRERSGVPYRELPISSVDRDINQPRVNFDEEKLKELAASIERYGVLTPILVRPSQLPGKFVVVAGERRLRASKMAGLSVIPAIVDADDGNSEVTLAKQIVENVQRADLTPLERAHAIGALKEANELSVREVAARLGVSKSMVQRSLELLDLPDDLLNALRQGASESKVLLLSKVPDELTRARLLKDIDETSRTDLKTLIEGGAPPAPSPKSSASQSPKKSELSPEDKRVADDIQRALGLKVTMSKTHQFDERGKLTIEFYSDDDLRMLFRRLVAEE